MKKLVLFSLILFQTIYVKAQKDNEHLNLNKKQIAIDGYDLVSYFLDDEAETGKKEYKYTYQGAHYFFSSENNLMNFKLNPTKYLPKFGGWCAYSMANNGEKERVDPKSFLILNDQLYLFYEYYFKDKREKWLESPKDLRKQAQRNWEKITQ